MSNSAATRPAKDEFAPYYSMYIDLVPEGDIVGILSHQLEETLALLRGVSEEKAGFRYAPDKWSIKELIGHLNDTERIMAYRALRFARNDQKPLSGFEQDDYVSAAMSDKSSLADLASELEHVRKANIFLFRQLSNEAWQRRGLANDKEISVRALAYIIAGHERHHIEILRSRYLTA